MADPGRRVRISFPLEDGNAGEQLQRLAGAAGRAADGLEKTQRSSEKASEETGRAAEKAREHFDNVRNVSITGAASGAVRALGQAGAGADDALFGAVRGARENMGAAGAALGALSPIPGGSFLGKALGEAAGVGVDRSVLQEARARDMALAETVSAFESATAQGQTITKEEYLEVFTQAIIIASRQIKNEGGARAAVGLFP